MKNLDLVQSWIDNVAYSHSKSEKTEWNYRHYFGLFCDFIGKTPEQILEEYKRMTDRDFRTKYAQYVRGLISHLGTQEEYTIGTVRFIVCTIKSFFKYNDLPLGHIPIARCKVTFHNRDITKEEIVDILKISRARDRAFFCIMAQSGLRPDTLCNLRLRHIEPDFSNGNIPCKIDIPQEIAKGEYQSYLTFMGEDSVRHLKTYLTTRPNIDKHSFLFTAHGIDKPLDRRSISHIFHRLVNKLNEKGLMDLEQKEKGKPSNIRLYNLRKFFRKQSAKAGEDFVNFWMGHTLGVDEHYFSRDPEFHRKQYAKFAMPYLRLETATPGETEQTIKELREQLAKRDQAIQDMQKKFEDFKELPNIVEKFSEMLGEKIDEATFDKHVDEFYDKLEARLTAKMEKIAEEVIKKAKKT